MSYTVEFIIMAVLFSMVLGGFMATGHWSGAVLCIVNIAVSILIYLPFVVMAEKMDAKKMGIDQAA